MTIGVCPHEHTSKKNKQQHKMLLDAATKKAEELGGHLVYSCDSISARIEMCVLADATITDERVLWLSSSQFDVWLESQGVGFVRIDSPGCKGCPGGGEAWILLWKANDSYAQKEKKLRKLPPKMLEEGAGNVHLGGISPTARRSILTQTCTQLTPK